MINSVAGIKIVNCFDKFFTSGVVAAILIWHVIYAMWIIHCASFLLCNK